MSNKELEIETNLQSDIALLYIEKGFDLRSPYIKKINMATTLPDTGSTVTVAGKLSKALTGCLYSC